MSTNRHSAGTVVAGKSAGGQFASSSRTEADAAALGDTDGSEQVSEEEISDLIDTLGLSHGNSEVEVDGDAVLISVEARNHATLRAAEAEQCVADGAALTEVKRALVKDLRSFAADEEFAEVWSPEFGKHNGFTPSEFLTQLQEDEQYFRSVANDLQHQVKVDQVLNHLSGEQIERARTEFEAETVRHYAPGELDPYDTNRGQGGYEDRFKVFLHREAENGVTW